MLDLLEQFPGMWDGHLGRNKAAKQRIELTSPEVRPIHSAPYRDGSKVRFFQEGRNRPNYENKGHRTSPHRAGRLHRHRPRGGRDDPFLRGVAQAERSQRLVRVPNPPNRRMHRYARGLEGVLRVGRQMWLLADLDKRAYRDKTALTSHHGIFSFFRMPFGLKNAPGSFQRAMDVILY